MRLAGASMLSAIMSGCWLGQQCCLLLNAITVDVLIP
jgi:hypothetical protein